jgi:hypothetical protein
MRHRPLALAASAFLLVSALAATPARAGASVKIDVRSEEGNRFNLSIGTGLVSGFVRAFAPMSIDCDEDRDDSPRVRELYLALEKAGEPSRGTLDDGDEFFDARRDRGMLHLTVTDDDGETATLEMPWNLARCVLGGEKISRGELVRAFESGGISIHVADGDETVRIAFE